MFGSSGIKRQTSLLWIICMPLSATYSEAADLVQPPRCSVYASKFSEQASDFCQIEVTPPPGGRELTVALTATTSQIEVGGYRLVTENYNGTYLPPLIEIEPGDRLKVRLLNALTPTKQELVRASHPHGLADFGAATNLHTHGLIVSPNNTTLQLAGDGDNVFASLGRGSWLDYNIPIPVGLPASVLDGGSGVMSHPNGLYWYHSHIHGISASQVSGGMSGLMSIGRSDSNLVARSNDALNREQLTAVLRANTDILHLMLRDIHIYSHDDPATAARNGAEATWDQDTTKNPCYPNVGAIPKPVPVEREGYCQNPDDPSDMWLFTVNGQRFPSIRVKSGRNALLRIANLSPNVTYRLRFVPERSTGPLLKFALLSVDGIVPGTPISAVVQIAPVRDAQTLTELVLMPAARAEIFLEQQQGGRYVLQTCEQHTGMSSVLDSCKPIGAASPSVGDHWPEIQLASVAFEEMPGATKISGMRPALNTLSIKTGAPPPPEPLTLRDFPKGCARDINIKAREHRRITFGGGLGAYNIAVDIVNPPDQNQLYSPDDFVKVEDENATIGLNAFDDYLKDNQVDWDATEGRPRHTCVRLSNGHGQLWELVNPTQELHNFHIHQMKFRLARDKDLEGYGIDPNKVRKARANTYLALIQAEDEDNRITWHDTVPVPENNGVDDGRVFIMLNFDALEQVGKFVFHCHILKHEDGGLMAPMEVIR